MAGAANAYVQQRVLQVENCFFFFLSSESINKILLLWHNHVFLVTNSLILNFDQVEMVWTDKLISKPPVIFQNITGIFKSRPSSSPSTQNLPV